MAVRQRKGGRGAEQNRALRLLAGSPVGYTEAIMLAAEMELMESRRPGEAWARHRGARAGVFGEAARDREIV
jgi:hypothetical protein